jgi:hypothetical protein
VLDAAGGKLLGSIRVAHSPEGLAKLDEWLGQMLSQQSKDQLACIIETTHGLLIAFLLEHGWLPIPNGAAATSFGSYRAAPPDAITPCKSAPPARDAEHTSLPAGNLGGALASGSDPWPITFASFVNRESSQDFLTASR